MPNNSFLMKNRKQISIDALQTKALTTDQLQQVKGGNDGTDGTDYIGSQDVIAI